jgi:hypothetical protein
MSSLPVDLFAFGSIESALRGIVNGWAADLRFPIWLPLLNWVGGGQNTKRDAGTSPQDGSDGVPALHRKCVEGPMGGRLHLKYLPEFHFEALP